jgi:hypothetical protein
LAAFNFAKGRISATVSPHTLRDIFPAPSNCNVRPLPAIGGTTRQPDMQHVFLATGLVSFVVPMSALLLLI